MIGNWSAACAIALLAAMLSAPSADADPNDDAFISALTKSGIAVADRDSATAMGQSVCDGFDQNQKTSFVALRVMKQSGLSLRQSSYVVGAAISAYCPEYVGHTDDSARWLNPMPPLM